MKIVIVMMIMTLSLIAADATKAAKSLGLYNNYTQALKNAKLDLKGYNNLIEYEEDPYRAAHKSHAIAVLTEWDIYKELDYEKIYEEMEKPAFIFDGRNILDHQKLFEIGFNVYPLGKPHLIHFKEA